MYSTSNKQSKMLSNRSCSTLISYTERSVQCCFKSNTYCVLLGDAQQFFCGFIGNIFVYTILQNQYNIVSNIYHNIDLRITELL